MGGREGKKESQEERKEVWWEECQNNLQDHMLFAQSMNRIELSRPICKINQSYLSSKWCNAQ